MKRILLNIVMLTSVLSAMSWSQKGHDVVANIAQRRLTPATAAAVDSLLDGKSMVYWANWLDNASHTPDYAYTKTWHYKNVDEGVRYEEAQANPSGDAVTAVKQQIELLSNPSTPGADPTLALKILIHVTGDMHQPMHMGHATDLGGNRVKVKYFGRDTNLHSVWDGSLVESAHKWSYTEWSDQIDRVSKEQEAAIVDGSIDDWAKQTLALANQVYQSTPEGTNLSYDQVAAATPVIEQQLLNGGLRLAHLLNIIFDPEYRAAH